MAPCLQHLRVVSTRMRLGCTTFNVTQCNDRWIIAITNEMRGCLRKTPCAILLSLPSGWFLAGASRKGHGTSGRRNGAPFGRTTGLETWGSAWLATPPKPGRSHRKSSARPLRPFERAQTEDVSGTIPREARNKGWSDITRWPCGGFVASPCLKPEKPAKHENTRLIRIP